tara:strand:- start:164 stop:562 length:399 start_codon:yes stop_codon:yes gene_type:complete
MLGEYGYSDESALCIERQPSLSLLLFTQTLALAAYRQLGPSSSSPETVHGKANSLVVLLPHIIQRSGMLALGFIVKTLETLGGQRNVEEWMREEYLHPLMDLFDKCKRLQVWPQRCEESFAMTLDKMKRNAM